MVKAGKHRAVGPQIRMENGQDWEKEGNWEVPGSVGQVPINEALNLGNGKRDAKGETQ